MKSKYLTEAIRIGDQLLRSASHDKHGSSWKTLALNGDSTFWGNSESIYSGVSGIALFLLNLAKITNDTKYLLAAEGAMYWVKWYCASNPTDYYALQTGRMGVSYVFLECYEISKKKMYLEEALSIAKMSGDFLKKPDSMNEFINGIAGTLIGLLHLHAAAPKPWLLALINQYTNELIKNAKYAKVGLYWDINDWQIRPLLGFSHGTSGVGFVFLELGHYFQNPAFYFIAEQAFAYENYYFDKKLKNWPDFRIDIFTEQKIKKLEKLYQKGNLDKFTKFHDMNTWCHGAAGIGLSRLRAFELLKKERYRIDNKRAINKNKSTNLQTFTLCHGNGGNAELFIENYLILNDQASLEQARSIADKLLMQKRDLGKYLPGLPSSDSQEDLSLFNGIAGIGYFLLRVNDSQTAPSILAPKLDKQTTEKYPITLSQIKSSLIENLFPRTLCLAKQFVPQKVHDHFIQDPKETSPKTLFISFVNKLLLALSNKQKKQLKNIFELELYKITLSQKKISNALLYIKQRVNQKNAQKILKLSDNTLLKYSFSLSQESTAFLTKSQGGILLQLTPYGVDETTISQFCEIVLRSFEKPKLVGDVVTEILALYNLLTEAEKQMIKENVLEQIKEAIEQNILVESATKSSG